MALDLFADRYRLDAVIAEGPFSTVYKAMDLRLQRPVAVKVMQNAAGSSEQYERFLQEARLLTRFKHPNVLVVHDGAIAGGDPFLVMEWLPGGTLRERLMAGPLPLREATQLIEELVNALEAARSQGALPLTHGTDDILLDGEGRAKLSHFELIAKDAHPADSDGALVRWLALLFYEMVTGKAAAATAKGITPPHVLNPEVPEALSTQVVRAVTDRAAQPFHSPAAFAAALARWTNQTGQPAPSEAMTRPWQVDLSEKVAGAVPPAPMVADASTSTPHHSRRALGALLLLLLLLGGAGITWGAARWRGARTETDSPAIVNASPESTASNVSDESVVAASTTEPEQQIFLPLSPA